MSLEKLGQREEKDELVREVVVLDATRGWKGTCPDFSREGLTPDFKPRTKALQLTGTPAAWASTRGFVA